MVHEKNTVEQEVKGHVRGSRAWVTEGAVNARAPLTCSGCEIYCKTLIFAAS